MISILRITLSVLLIGSLALLGIGCSEEDDNPVDTNGSEHFEAVGCMLISGSDTLMTITTSDSADVEGEIHVHEGDTTEIIETRFYSHEGEWFNPAGDEIHSLFIVVGNGDVIEWIDHDWSFHLKGIMEGETWIRVRVDHEDHYGYLSPRLPVHVEHSEGAHGAPVGMRIKLNESVIIEADASNTVTGHFDLTVNSTSEPFEAFFYDEHDVEFQPETDHSLGITIDDPGLVEVKIGEEIPDNANIWKFMLKGLQAGATNASFSIMHGDHAHYVSPEIDVHVE